MCTGEPFSATWAGCGGTTRSGGQGHCGGQVSWVGVKFFRYPRPVLYLAFACNEHVEQLDVARPIDDSDRAEIERRHERHRLVVVDGHPYEPEPPLAPARRRAPGSIRRVATARAGQAGESPHSEARRAAGDDDPRGFEAVIHV